LEDAILLFERRETHPPHSISRRRHLQPSGGGFAHDKKAGSAAVAVRKAASRPGTVPFRVSAKIDFTIAGEASVLMESGRVVQLIRLLDNFQFSDWATG